MGTFYSLHSDIAMRFAIILSFILLAASANVVDDVTVRFLIKHSDFTIQRLEEKLIEVSDPDSPQWRKFLTEKELFDIVYDETALKTMRNHIFNSLSKESPEACFLLSSGDVLECVYSSLDTVRIRERHNSYKHSGNNVYPEYNIQDLIILTPKGSTENRFPDHTTWTVVEKFQVLDGFEYSNELKLDTEGLSASPVSRGSPSVQKQLYGIDETKTADPSNNNKQMVWGPGTFGVDLDDLDTYFQKFNIPASIDDVSLPGFKGKKNGDNFLEGSLDATCITTYGPRVATIVMNSNSSSSTEEGNGFGYAFLNELVSLSQTKQSDLPYVLSLSLGSLSFESCEILCSKAKDSNGDPIDTDDCKSYLNTQRQVCMFDSADQVNRMDVELMKLGIRGVSIVGATGDGGSHFSFQPFPPTNSIAKALNKVSCEYNLPTYPASSPYVTGVGGISFKLFSSTPIAWSRSGGGFSWISERLSYQSQDVDEYLSQLKSLSNPSVPIPPESSYNSTNRGFPDVATVATGVPIVNNGMVMQVGGTSASAPTFAGIISLINDACLSSGKPVLGFLNPAFYKLNRQYPGELFKDITSGETSCECDSGFPALKGWDPTTGLGYPNYPGLIKHLVENYDL